MTIPATEKPLIDLTWVEFSEEHDQVCTIKIGCSNQASWEADWESTCVHISNKAYYCDAHMKMQIEENKKPGKRLCSRIFPVHLSNPYCPGSFWMVNYYRIKR